METDRGSIGVGAFFIEESTEVRLSSDTLGTGTLINFQDDLGFDEDEEVARIAGHYRFKPRHRINFSYFDLSNAATTTLLRDIQFEDTIFTAGSAVRTELDFKVLNVLYTYSFLQKPKLELGVSAGVNVYDFDSSITAPQTQTREEGDGTASLPVVGVRIRYAFKPKFLFGASFDYFEIDKSNVEGQVIDILVGVEHQTWKNAGLGLGYNDVSLEAEDKEDEDEIDWEYDGFFAYVRFDF